jgi:spectinomycin phosphotransferase
VKLRRGALDEASVAVPYWLSEQGVAQVIPPLLTLDGRLWAVLESYTLICYPFVDGRDGYTVDMTEEHWRVLGAALVALHTAEVPPRLAALLRRERFEPTWRVQVRGFLAGLDQVVPPDAAATELVVFLRERRTEVTGLVDEAEARAAVLEADPPPFVLCHGDAHAGNVLIDQAGALYLVDWDTLVLAPKERDLMFVGGAQGFRGCSPEEEVARFARGYGHALVDRRALAYYRYERIVQDFAAYCAQLLLSTEGGEDRPQALRYLKGNFLPGGTIDAARSS